MGNVNELVQEINSISLYKLGEELFHINLSGYLGSVLLKSWGISSDQIIYSHVDVRG